MKRRRLYHHPGIDRPNTDGLGYPDDEIEELKLDDPKANVVGSRLDGIDLHAPAIDLDVPAVLVPSSTPGHFHLYIDVPMTWRQYRRMLAAMVDAGVVEPGYYAASKRRKQTLLRREGVKKKPPVDEVPF